MPREASGILEPRPLEPAIKVPLGSPSLSFLFPPLPTLQLCPALPQGGLALPPTQVAMPHCPLGAGQVGRCQHRCSTARQPHWLRVPGASTPAGAAFQFLPPRAGARWPQEARLTRRSHRTRLRGTEPGRRVGLQATALGRDPRPVHALAWVRASLPKCYWQKDKTLPLHSSVNSDLGHHPQGLSCAQELQGLMSTCSGGGRIPHPLRGRCPTVCIPRAQHDATGRCQHTAGPSGAGLEGTHRCCFSRENG